jgi:hypothetical protein
VLRRVTEGVVVAVLSTLAGALLGTDAGRQKLLDGALTTMGSAAATWLAYLWILAGALVLLGVGARLSILALGRGDIWAVLAPMLGRVGMPLVGLGCAIGVAATALQVAAVGSVWAFPLAAVALYGAVRWSTAVRGGLRPLPAGL